MDQENNGNGNTNGRQFVKFGPLDTQEIAVDWAEKMLTELYKLNPAMFGRLLQSAAGVPPRTR